MEYGQRSTPSISSYYSAYTRRTLASQPVNMSPDLHPVHQLTNIDEFDVSPAVEYL
jgi:hypothetical protein